MQRAFPWTRIKRGDPSWRRRRVVQTLVTAGFVLSVLGILSLCKPWFYFVFNASNSMSGLVYLVLPGRTPALGDVVAFYPPENSLYHGKRRFLKIVKGIEGDRIDIKDHHVFLNGIKIGWVHEQANNGLLLRPIESTVIPEGRYFVWTPHDFSYDSRYREIGLISDDALIGTAHRIL